MTEIPVDRIRVGPRFRRELGDLGELKRSIEAVGLLHPVVVDPAGNLLAGARRLAACVELGWTQIPATIVDADALLVEAHENIVRQDFLPSEAVAIADAVEARDRGRPASACWPADPALNQRRVKRASA
ncbi:MAG TPA: ParB N-terminal domain-containing protein [Candidatus Eisenbacteria bacterium]|jgi:ParB family chromosome partitioning protein